MISPSDFKPPDIDGVLRSCGWGGDDVTSSHAANVDIRRLLALQEKMASERVVPVRVVLSLATLRAIAADSSRTGDLVGAPSLYSRIGETPVFVDEDPETRYLTAVNLFQQERCQVFCEDANGRFLELS